jgi:hypothetical protein
VVSEQNFHPYHNLGKTRSQAKVTEWSGVEVREAFHGITTRISSTAAEPSFGMETVRSAPQRLAKAARVQTLDHRINQNSRIQSLFTREYF